MRASGAAGLAAGFGVYVTRARARLAPASMRMAHVSDTFFMDDERPGRAGVARPGWLFDDAYLIADDVLEQARALETAPALVLHSGNLIRSFANQFGPKSGDVRRWIDRAGAPVRLTLGDSDARLLPVESGGPALGFTEAGKFKGARYYSYDANGFHFFHLDTSPSHAPLYAPGRLADRDEQLAALSADLAEDPATPAILVMHAPLDKFDSPTGLALVKRDRRAVMELARAHPRVVLVLCGKSLEMRARALPGTGALCLVTGSLVRYPCGGRVIDVAVGEGGAVRIESRFVQTRRQDLVELSFHDSSESRRLSRLGSREDRSFAGSPSSEALTIVRNEVASAPTWWDGRDEFTLAALSDTHLCLDELASDQDRQLNWLLGHYMGEASAELFEDALAQVASGRHRVEFFDEVFAKAPEADEHYLELPVDALLLNGDLAEHGARGELEIVRQGLADLPPSLRERTLVTPGNHDYYDQEFAAKGSASDRGALADFFKDYGPGDGGTNYLVHLSDWVTLMVLDLTVPTHDGMGLIQERIEWVDDQLHALSGRAVVIAAHHAIYPLSTEAPVYYAFSRMMYNFTPHVSAARTLLQDVIARHANVKMLLSGHFHGTVVDQHPKREVAGGLPGDRVVTHVQVPCVVEYPCAYRLFTFKRSGKIGRIGYQVAITRRSDLRMASREATIYRVLGMKVRAPAEYEKIMAAAARQDNLLGRWAAANPFDAARANIRGFKDGTANAGRGNSEVGSIRGEIEFTI